MFLHSNIVIAGQWVMNGPHTIFHSLICSIISKDIVLNVATGFCMCLCPSVTVLLHRRHREIVDLRSIRLELVGWFD